MAVILTHTHTYDKKYLYIKNILLKFYFYNDLA